LYWLVGESTHILGHLHPDLQRRSRYRARATALAEKLGIQQYIGDLLRHQESWERVLKTFERIARGTPQTKGPNAQRVVWFIDMDAQTLEPKEQKWGKNERWTAGRKIAPTQLLYDKLDSFTNQDQAVVKSLRSRYRDRIDPRIQYRNDELYYDFAQALYLLAGHPHLYLVGRQQIPIEIMRAKPQLFLTETEQGIHLRMEPRAQRSPYVIQQETPTRYRAYYFSDTELQLAKAIGEGTHMPKETIGRLELLLDDLQEKVTVHSSLALADSDLPKVEGDATPCLHLLPFKEGLKLQFTVKPLAEESLYFPAGEGIARQVITTSDGERILSRDLLAEQSRKDAVITACPVLQRVEGFNNEWQLENIEDCLQLLLELRPLQEAGTITVEYPKGEKIRLRAVNSTGDLSVRVQKERDWFEVDGELRVDEGQVLEFSKLLAHLKKSDSPFVELKPGEFIALTEEFQQRLHEIEGMLQQKGKHWQLSELAAPALEDIAAELAELEVDAAWQEKLRRMEKAQRIRPRVPKDFRAELRPYQLDGFRWLSRLAAWGVGACLADDMGLGKTVQALALLSARAKHGPSLVIAPASVARNWIAETNRFAPGLLPHLLETSKDAEWVTQLEAGDLLVVSYGLLPFVEDLLIAKPFNVIVLDEAQAIKNRATKRSQIVMELQADFRIATTGTPIENHLGELWNLFRFLNPGLLGSQRHFNEKFAKPIQRDNDPLRREQLRRMIRPFILRRHKSEVLTELPPKTEVILTVE
ncbi:MAG: DEAD/DEAH box helicase, partial [Bacteroidetes bacterium]